MSDIFFVQISMHHTPHRLHCLLTVSRGIGWLWWMEAEKFALRVFFLAHMAQNVEDVACLANSYAATPSSWIHLLTSLSLKEVVVEALFYSDRSSSN